jgi:hypothetical protein
MVVRGVRGGERERESGEEEGGMVVVDLYYGYDVVFLISRLSQRRRGKERKVVREGNTLFRPLIPGTSLILLFPFLLSFLGLKMQV